MAPGARGADAADGGGAVSFEYDDWRVVVRSALPHTNGKDGALLHPDDIARREATLDAGTVYGFIRCPRRPAHSGAPRRITTLPMVQATPHLEATLGLRARNASQLPDRERDGPHPRKRRQARAVSRG